MINLQVLLNLTNFENSLLENFSFAKFGVTLLRDRRTNFFELLGMVVWSRYSQTK